MWCEKGIEDGEKPSPLIVRDKACAGRTEKSDTLIKGFDELEKYRSIGTTDEFRASIEKRTAKRPILNDLCTCPSCGIYNEILKIRRRTFPSDIVYCWQCGQASKIFMSDENLMS